MGDLDDEMLKDRKKKQNKNISHFINTNGYPVAKRDKVIPMPKKTASILPIDEECEFTMDENMVEWALE
jgi:hypothetical protein